MSLRVVPSSSAKSASIQDTTNSQGLHDTLQYGPRSLATEAQTHSELQSRLENWEETQDGLHLNLQRNVYGLHAPVRLLMERKVASTSRHMMGPNLHLDILMGRDERLDYADVFGDAEMSPHVGIHAQMEKKLKM